MLHFFNPILILLYLLCPLDALLQCTTNLYLFCVIVYFILKERRKTPKLFSLVLKADNSISKNEIPKTDNQQYTQPSIENVLVQVKIM